MVESGGGPPALPAQVAGELARRGTERFVTHETGNLTLMSTPDGPRMVATPGEVYVDRRPVRPDRRPPKPALFVDRVSERAKCSAASPFVLELFGEYGVGKSTLLSMVADQAIAAAQFADGVVSCDPLGYDSYDDFLFYLWDHFYLSNLPWTYRPTQASLFSLMRDIDALVTIDDCGFSERELQGLQTVAANCSVILASEQQLLTNFGRSLLVTGLPPEVMHEVARAQLRRRFLDEDLLPDETIATVWAECKGNARLFERAISRWATEHSGGAITSGEPAELERRLIEVVHILDNGSPVPADVLDAVAGPDSGARARDLWQRGELDAHSPRYSCPWPAPLIPHGRAAEVRAAALSYLAHEAGLRRRPELRQFALRLAGTVVERDDPVDTEELTDVLRQLTDSYLGSGSLDGWGQAAAIALRHGKAVRSAPLIGWASHHLGAKHLCRGEHGTARRHLENALNAYHDDWLTGPDAIDACTGLLELAVQAADSGPDEDTGSASAGWSGHDPSGTSNLDDPYGAAAAVPDQDDEAEAATEERTLATSGV